MTDQGPVDPLAPSAGAQMPPDGGAQVATATGNKPDIGKRAIAAIIDGAIAGAVGLIPILGGIVGTLYILLRDGFEYDFMDGRSIGKKLMKLRPVRHDGGKMDLSTSIKRNWPVCLGSIASILLIVPVLGWILFPIAIIAAVILGIIEIVLVVTSQDGRRWGDKLAGTAVIETAD